MLPLTLDYKLIDSKGVKDTTGSVAQISETVRKSSRDFIVLAGSGGYLLQVRREGEGRGEGRRKKRREEKMREGKYLSHRH